MKNHCAVSPKGKLVTKQAIFVFHLLSPSSEGLDLGLSCLVIIVEVLSLAKQFECMLACSGISSWKMYCAGMHVAAL